MMLSSNTISSLIGLFIVTYIVIYGIFKTMKPPYMVVDKKFNTFKAIYTSAFFSLLFTLFVFFISNKVDTQNNKKNFN